MNEKKHSNDFNQIILNEKLMQYSITSFSFDFLEFSMTKLFNIQ